MDLKILLREFGTDCLGLVLLQFRTKRPPPSSAPPGSKGLGLFVDEFLQFLLGQVIQLHLEPEGFLRDRLVGRVVVLQQGGVMWGPANNWNGTKLLAMKYSFVCLTSALLEELTCKWNKFYG